MLSVRFGPIMRLLRFHVVPLQELAVVDMEVFDSRDGDEEIGADIANFALYVALLVTRIWIAELHAAPIMRAEAPKHLIRCRMPFSIR